MGKFIVHCWLRFWCTKISPDSFWALLLHRHLTFFPHKINKNLKKNDENYEQTSAIWLLSDENNLEMENVPNFGQTNIRHSTKAVGTNSFIAILLEMEISFEYSEFLPLRRGFGMWWNENQVSCAALYLISLYFESTFASLESPFTSWHWHTDNELGVYVT